MGRFFACLCIFKHRKSKNSSNSIPSGVQKREAHQFPEPQKAEKIENPITTVPESKDKFEDYLSFHSTEKVTFGLNLKSEEENFLKQSANDLAEKEKIGEKREETLNESEFLLPIAVASYPSNQRYQNCRDSDSKLEDFELPVKELDESYIDEDDYGGEAGIKEESSESLFSLSIESRKPVSGVEADEKEISSPLSIKSQKPVSGAATDEKEISSHVSTQNIVSNATSDEKEMDSPKPKPVESVLNPIERRRQWKKMKARAAPLVTHHDKENIKQDINIVVPISLNKPLAECKKQNADHPKLVDEGIAVDASFSSWLVELETTPNSKTSSFSVRNSPFEAAKSPRRQEDVTILLGGALTMEEIEQESAASSPRRSWRRSPSPDEEPIIGTVGSYLCHTGQNMDTGSSSCGKGVFSTRGAFIEENREAEFYTF